MNSCLPNEVFKYSEAWRGQKNSFEKFISWITGIKIHSHSQNSTGH